MSFFKDFKNDLSMAVNNLPADNPTDDLLNAPQDADTVVLDDFGDMSTEEPISVDDLILEVPTEETESIIEDTSSADSFVEEVTFDEPIIETASVEENTVVEQMPSAEVENLADVTETEESVEETIEEVSINEPAEEIVEIPVVEEIPEINEEITSGEEVNKMSEIDEKFANEPATDESAIITEGMKVTGDIISTGNMDVLGTVKGNIDIKGKLTITGIIEGSSKAAEIFADSAKITGNIESVGSVKVGQSSVIVGDIVATSAVIAGAVKGNIDVHGPVILDTSAIVMGDIKSKSVQINNGAVIEGHCSQCYAEVSPTSFFNDVK